MTQKKDEPGPQAPAEQQGPVQRYRFHVRTADGRELVSDIVTVKLPPAPAPAALAAASPPPPLAAASLPPPLAAASLPPPLDAVGMVATPLLQMQPVAPAAAPKNYTFARMLVTVEGSKQKFHVDSAAKTLDSHQFAAVEMELGLRAPIDAASGQRSGKHQHDQVVLIRELGPSTPQFFAALVNNETLTSVVCDCYGMETKGGKEELYFTVKLSNASVASTGLQKPNNKYPDLMKVPDLQRISFTYEKIEWAWKNGVSASDDWQERN